MAPTKYAKAIAAALAGLAGFYLGWPEPLIVTVTTALVYALPNRP